MRKAIVVLMLCASACFAQSASTKKSAQKGNTTHPQIPEKPQPPPNLPTIPVFDQTAMDKSVNPCENFYKYACGGWMEKNPIPSDQAIWGRFNELQERNRDILHDILEKAAKGGANRSAVAQFTKKDIQRLFAIPDEKIEVIYNAIDDRFRQGHASDADREFIAERFQTNYPFILYAGRISPHKNIIRIIEAFSALKAELDKEGKYPDLKLIIIGDEVSRHPDLRRAVIRSGVQNDVRFLGFVSIDTLRTFYDVAKVFVFPSLYEGFGLPPLEAMAHGTPVVTSNTSSLPEVVDSAAVLVNPENVFDIMRALHRVLVDQSMREKLKQRGYEQVQRFSWDDSVHRILRVYREVAGKMSSPART